MREYPVWEELRLLRCLASFTLVIFENKLVIAALEKLKSLFNQWNFFFEETQ